MDQNGCMKYAEQEEFTQYFPTDGWVEHDPKEIWETTLNVSRKVLDYAANLQGHVAAAGITNQRETSVVWDRRTGDPVYNEIGRTRSVT